MGWRRVHIFVQRDSTRTTWVGVRVGVIWKVVGLRVCACGRLLACAADCARDAGGGERENASAVRRGVLRSPRVECTFLASLRVRGERVGGLDAHSRRLAARCCRLRVWDDAETLLARESLPA